MKKKKSTAKVKRKVTKKGTGKAEPKIKKEEEIGKDEFETCIAYHEAGYLIMRDIFRIEKMYSATILPNEQKTFEKHQVRPDLLLDETDEPILDTKIQIEIEQNLMMLLAGFVANNIRTQETDSLLPYVKYIKNRGNFLELVNRLTSGSDNLAREWTYLLMLRVTAILEKRVPWHQIDALAKNLIKKKKLSQKEIEETCRNAVATAQGVRSHILEKITKKDQKITPMEKFSINLLKE